MSRDRYGTGTITITARGRFRVRIPDGRGGVQSVGTYDTREQAEQKRSAALIAGADLADLYGISLYEYGELWIEKCARAGMRDAPSMRSRWSTIVARAPFARIPVEVVTRAEIRDWAQGLTLEPAKRARMAAGRVKEVVDEGRSLSWQSARHALGLLSRCLTDALEAGLRLDNPARGIKLPRRVSPTEGWTYLTPAEIGAVLALDLSAEQRTAITVAIYQGLRQGELAALDWQRVDLQRLELLIAASWDGPTKTGKVRRIPLLEPAAAALAAWQKEGTGGLVFPGRDGIRARGYCWGWDDRRYGKDIPQRAGITRRVRFHDLRHTCAAALVSGSWGRAWRLEEVRDFLGHSSISVTERYAHLAPAALAATAARTAKLDAHLTRRERRHLNKSLKSLAPPAGFEPATFGLGSRGEPNNSAGIDQISQVRVKSFLEGVAAGRPVAEEDLLALADLVLDSPLARLARHIRVPGPHRLDYAIRLARGLLGPQLQHNLCFSTHKSAK